MAAPHVSGILAFVAGILHMFASNPPFAGTPTGVFFDAAAVFVVALTVYLLAQGSITLKKK